MFKIQTLNKIAACGLNKFNENYNVSDSQETPDAIVLRSFNMHETELPSSLKAVARAGAGTNNIPIDKCSEKGIVVFNTPGANANAVKEIVIAGLMLSSRKISNAMDWVQTLKGNGADVTKQVEKGKSAFAGPEISGKTLGVIGLGAIGVMVANAAYHLGMEVIGYDPYMSVDAAWSISRHVEKSADLNEIFAKCDYISLHVPLNDSTRGMVNSEILANAKDGIRILNFARGELVDNEAIKAAAASGKVSCYVTDFPCDEVLGVENIIAIPHLGASTPESEDNCAVMACQQIIDYLENGNIKNSVNFPECSMPRSADIRITIAHKNVHGMINKFSGLFAERKINIENFINKSKKDMAYTIIDTNTHVSEDDVKFLSDMEDVLSVNVIE